MTRLHQLLAATLVSLCWCATAERAQREPKSKLDFRWLTVPVSEARQVAESFTPWVPKSLKFHGVNRKSAPLSESPYCWRYSFSEEGTCRFYHVNWVSGELVEVTDLTTDFRVYEERIRPAESISREQAIEKAWAFLLSVFPDMPREHWQVDSTLPQDDKEWRREEEACDRANVRFIQRLRSRRDYEVRSYNGASISLTRKSGETYRYYCTQLAPPDADPYVDHDGGRATAEHYTKSLLEWLVKPKGASPVGVEMEEPWLTAYSDDLALRRLCWMTKTVTHIAWPNEGKSRHRDDMLIDATTGAMLYRTWRSDLAVRALRMGWQGNVICRWYGELIDLALPCKAFGEEPYMAAQYLSSFGYAMQETPTELRFTDKLTDKRGKPPLQLALNREANEVRVTEGRLLEPPRLVDGVAYLHLRDMGKLTDIMFFFGRDTDRADKVTHRFVDIVLPVDRNAINRQWLAEERKAAAAVPRDP